MVNTVIIARCFPPACKKSKPSVRPDRHRGASRKTNDPLLFLTYIARGRQNMGISGPRVPQSGLSVALFVFA
jgi:hypothetical protein